MAHVLSQAAPALNESAFPDLFHQADTLSARAQKRFFRLLGAELIFLFLGTLAGLLTFVPLRVSTITLGSITIPALPVADLAAAVLILIALVMRLIRAFRRLDTIWYEARAIAESAKSITWRYAVGGHPFELGLSESVDDLVVQRLQESLTDVSRAAKKLTFSTQGQISDAMRALRSQDLATRQHTYEVDRIEDQQKWYTRKAQFNHVRAVQFHWLLVSLEVIGVMLALLQALGIVPENFQVLLAALVSGGIAWTQTRRYQDLYASYRVAGKEATSLEQKAQELSESEATWGRFVDEAEEAFSREHRLWRATRDEEQK